MYTKVDREKVLSKLADMQKLRELLVEMKESLVSTSLEELKRVMNEHSKEEK